MRLSRYLRPDLVLTDLSASDRAGVLQRLSAHLEQRGVIGSGPEVEEAFEQRERTHTTLVGDGVALPHATVPDLDEPVLLVAVAPDGVPFGATPDAERVSVFFALVSPPGRENEHIKILARICRLARQSGFAASLAAAGGGESVLEEIRRLDEQHF